MTAAVLDPLVLPADVVIAPVAELPPELRDQVEHRPDDYSVTRPLARTTSSIVDRKTAALLDSFRTPTTIVDAVIAFSSAEGLDPREMLDDAFAVLGGFINEGVLVAPDSELAQPIATTLAAGDSVAAFEVVAPVHVLVDTEVYFARAADGAPVALKVARPGAEVSLGRTLAHEAGVLTALDGRVTPRLIELGQLDERPFLAMSWCSGTDVFQAAADARSLGGPEGRAELLALAEGVAAAYAHLHAQAVLHGDVHPRNLLVDADGGVTIIDFGLAAGLFAPEAAPGRGGIDFFMEPELALARLERRPTPPLSEAGEQYSVAALVYLLLTGAHTNAFSMEQEEMLHQLVEQPPLPFEHHGVTDLAAVEQALGRALTKDPRSRYGSMRELARALGAAVAADGGGAHAPARRAPGPARELLDEVLVRLAVPGELSDGGLVPPLASAMNGGAGFAYALLRIAESRGDESLLALADLWSTRSTLALESPEAFWNEELEIVPQLFGENSYYHTAAGVHGVHALVAAARGDGWDQRLALERFVATASEPCEHVDAAFGRTGLLLGCSIAEESRLPGLDGSALRALGDRLRDELWTELERQPPLREGTQLKLLGAAHGWAGYLYALLRWSEATGTPPAPGVAERLEQLGALGEPFGRGLRWSHEVGAGVRDSALAASWCNGAAGLVHLWMAAHRVLGDEAYARLGARAAWTAYETQAEPGDLCCGLAGRAYALLSLYRHTDESGWLARGRMLADEAATSIRAHSLRRDSLYKGDVGVAVLAADLQAPEFACMPLY